MSFYLHATQHIQLSQTKSTFTDAPEHEKEIDCVSFVKNEPNDSNQQGLSDQGQEENGAPLVEGEDTDDELGKNYPKKLCLQVLTKNLSLVKCS